MTIDQPYADEDMGREDDGMLTDKDMASMEVPERKMQWAVGNTGMAPERPEPNNWQMSEEQMMSGKVEAEDGLMIKDGVEREVIFRRVMHRFLRTEYGLSPLGEQPEE